MAGGMMSNIFTRAGQFIVYLLFRVVECALRLLPIRACAFFGSTLGWLAYFFLAGYRKISLRNLEIAFGRETDPAWRRRVARKHFQTLGGNFLCGLKLPLMSEEDIVRRVTLEGMEHAEAVVRAGRPTLFAACHLSCWELLAQIPSLLSHGRKPAGIYQPLSNRFLEAHVKKRREKSSFTMFDRTKGFSAPLKHLRAGGGGLGVFVDQHAGDKGVWCPFFDRLASTSNLPALMALRCNTPLLPLAVYNDGPARWRVVCYPPVNSLEAKPTAEGMTAMLNIAVEIMIRRAPENWFWVHDRWKTPRPNFLLSNTRRGISLPTGYDVKRLQPFKLIVRTPNWLGDACMALPAIRALKKGRPDMQITVLAPAKLAELWRMIPEVDGVIVKNSRAATGEVVQRIRDAGTFDAAVLFTNSTRSALELWHSEVPRIAGYRGSIRSWLVNQIVPEARGDSPPEHHAERYLRIAAYCGAECDKALEFPRRPIPQDDMLRIGICAGAEYGPAKKWPLERFAEVANRLFPQPSQVEWQLFGAPGEKAMGEQLSALMTHARHVNHVGRTSLTELIQQLQRCRLLLTNDTGTMHLAAALGVPTVSIFGSTEPVLTGPLGNRHIIVRNHLACSPCFRRECPFGHYECMTGVTVERVAAQVLRALSA